MQKQIHKQDRPEVAGLIEKVKNGSIYNSLMAAGELKDIGEDAVDPLMAAFNESGTNAIRWRIAMALARMGDVAVDDLIKVMDTDDTSRLNPAIWALSAIGDQRAVEPLVNCMNCSTEECCRALTAAALLKIGDPAGVNAVEEMLQSSSENFKGQVFEALEGS